MPTADLPDRPDLERLKGHAKVLRDLVRAGVDGSIQLVREHHPRHGDLVAGSPGATGFKLADAQLTIARHYGFSSWPRLRAHVELINDLTRSPHEQAIGGELADDAARADELLRLACLNYGADNPTRWADAERLLAEHPHLSRASIHTAAATGDVAAAGDLLAADPSLANADGGPFRWAPLLYLTYSRLPLRPGREPLAVARLLLDAGADPNAGFLWDGLPSPFTALTGVFGRGEQGAPPHPQEMALARLLLDAGAEANDSQTIYNRGLGDIASDDTEFLVLLFDHGLGRGDGGPWRRRLGDAHQTPADMLADALQHATSAGLVQRTQLLLAHQVDPNRASGHPIFRRRTPYDEAVLNGNPEVADLLAAAGADTGSVDPLTRLIGLAMAADRAGVAAAQQADPTLLDRARAERPDLVARAAEAGRPDAVTLLVELGFDVNARHRTTALHEAALRNDRATVERLLALGADPTILDTEFDSPPAGWAAHSGHHELSTFLNERATDA